MQEKKLDFPQFAVFLCLSLWKTLDFIGINSDSEGVDNFVCVPLKCPWSAAVWQHRMEKQEQQQVVQQWH